jgi:malto-oligosyltrehalose trehalohydrolase
MRRRHSMPFGTRLLADGKVRFRLWAPANRRVELMLDHRRLDLEPAGGGWFGGEVEASPGSYYRFQLDGDLVVPDPASRFQPSGVHGPSEVIDPCGYLWQDRAWRGRPWTEAVIYELHVGAFSRAGSYAGIGERLDYLRDLGVTAIELMPLADFPGARNWGYDGVLPFAPARAYGRPEELKALVDAAHARNLMVLLDVVYNHFGPDGNYLYAYASPFFTDRHQTPWGKAIDFSRAAVRDFFIHNVLYWLEEYHLDGLRLDSVHDIIDDSDPEILVELAETVRESAEGRHVHLVLENGANEARYLERTAKGEARWYVAQWNDDFHHAAHAAATGEGDGYYADFAGEPILHLGRCLSEGFAFQGDVSSFFGGVARGESSTHLPLAAFVNFLQNHDQVGNRALGDRLGTLTSPEALAALTVVTLLSPSPPLLFMGQEWCCTQPFLFFCDHHAELAAAVRHGRRQEFARFAQFADPEARGGIPDPNAPATFARSRLRWRGHDHGSRGQWLDLHRRLLQVRREWLIPRLANDRARAASSLVVEPHGLRVSWVLADDTSLHLVANLGPAPADLELPRGRTLAACPAALAKSDRLCAPWSVVVRHDPTVASGLGTIAA